MKKPLCRINYKTKLSFVLIGIGIVPILAAVISYYVFAVGYNRQNKLDEYRSWLVNGVVQAQESISAAAQGMKQFEDDTDLARYLANPASYYLTQKIDLFGLNKKYLSDIKLNLSNDIARSIRIYGANLTKDMIIPGPMYAFSELERFDPAVAELAQSGGPDTLYQIVSGTGQSNELRVYQFKMDLYGRLLAVNRMEVPFSYYLHSLEEQLVPNALLIYTVKGREPIVLQQGKLDLDGCIKEYEKYRDKGCPEQSGDYFVLASDFFFSSSEALTEGFQASPAPDQILFFVPKRVVYQEEMHFLLNAFLLVLLLIALVIIVIRFVSYFLTRRLYQLLDDVSVDTAKLISGEKILAVDGFDEFGRIRSKFREIVGEIQDYSEQALYAEYEQRILKAELMQDLIAPHFLYNTLDGMRWSTDDPKLIQVVNNMVTFYRLALNKGSSFVTLAQEYELVRAYLEVQRFAYESDFRYDMIIGEGISDIRILKHIIQPILENALVHGIDKRSDHGYVCVSSTQKDGLLVIDISDNGAGMTEDKCQALLEGGSQVGYGIHNVIQRIHLFYGEEYGLQIESTTGKGTTVQVRLPLNHLYG